jgi:rhamnulokinase
MLAKLAEFARSTNQPEPRAPGAAVRACLESLALSYREKLLTLESILDRKFEVIHIVGGGGRNALLCQMTADATGRRVIVGPHEATALGNALIQAKALGNVKNLAELRMIVANSTELVTYEPVNIKEWDAAYKRFQTLI